MQWAKYRGMLAFSERVFVDIGDSLGMVTDNYLNLNATSKPYGISKPSGAHIKAETICAEWAVG
jgi:hypothetical protein